MAMASAAHALGYKPYWMDLNSYGQTTCTKVISSQNDLYSLGSRISQKSRLFNRFVWEPINYEGFRQLSYNASDQKNAELMATELAMAIRHNLTALEVASTPHLINDYNYMIKLAAKKLAVTQKK